MEYEALGRKQKEESCPNYCKAKAKSLNIKAPMDLRLKGKKKKGEMYRLGILLFNVLTTWAGSCDRPEK